MPDLPDPQLAFAFEARVEIAPSIRIGGSADEDVWFTPITGGSVTGPRLTGTVLPYGGDWSTTRPTGSQLDARYLLQADDGTVIGIHNRGYWVADPATEERIESGEHVCEADYYYRTAPVFQVAAGRHDWLTRTVFVGMARDEGAVCIRFYELG